MNDQKLKHKLYIIIFESDTPSGKLFDVVLTQEWTLRAVGKMDPKN